MLVVRIIDRLDGACTENEPEEIIGVTVCGKACPVRLGGAEAMRHFPQLIDRDGQALASDRAEIVESGAILSGINQKLTETGTDSHSFTQPCSASALNGTLFGKYLGESPAIHSFLHGRNSTSATAASNCKGQCFDGR